MTHTVRVALESDIPAMMQVIDEAKTYFKENEIDQWQDGYPNQYSLLLDIENRFSYVMVDNLTQQVVATAAITQGPEEAYNDITGAWLTGDATTYLAVHRIAIASALKGNNLAKQLIDYAEQLCLQKNCLSVRIDTHEDNLSMQKFVGKHGYTKCGDIYIPDVGDRIAYEKIIKE